MNPEAKKLCIAMVAACPFPGNRGTPSRILRMAEGLQDLGHEVHVVTYHFGVDIETRGIRIHRIPRIVRYRNLAPGPTLTKLLLLDPLLFFKLLGVVRRHRVEIIHAHHFEGALVSYPVRFFLRIPTVYDAHTTLEGELSSYKFWNPVRLRRTIDRLVPRLADHVVAVSEELQSWLTGLGIPAHRVSCVPTGVNPESFEGQDRTLVRTRYGFQDRIVAVYTGTLQEYQGIDLLLQAMKQVAARNPEVGLLVAGNSNLETYKQMASRLGIGAQVIFLGETPFQEIPSVLAASDIAVLPRVDCPGIPQKLTNYMAAGKAIVAFEGSAKYLKHRETGIVVPNGDVSAMSEAILELAGDVELRNRLGAGARERILGNLDWVTLCSKLEEIYFSVLGRRGCHHAPASSPYNVPHSASRDGSGP